MTTQIRAELRIYYPKLNERELLQAQLQEETKATLQEMASPFVRLLKTHRLLALVGGQEKEPDAVSNMRPSGNKLKVVFVEFLAVMVHPKNYAIIFKGLSPKMRKLMTQVATDFFITAGDANTILGEHCIDEECRSYYDDSAVDGPCKGLLKSTPSYFIDASGRSHSHYNFVYPYKCLNKAIIEAFYPHEGKAVDELPHDSELTIYSAEHNVVGNANTLSLLYDQSVIPPRGEKPRVAQVKSAAKAFPMPEFFPDSTDRKLRQLALPMVMRFYSTSKMFFYHVDLSARQSDDILSMLRTTFRYAFSLNTVIVQTLLPSLKGFLRGDMEVYQYRRSRHSNSDDGLKLICNELKYLPEGKWLSVNELTYRIRMQVQDEHSPFFLVDPFDYSNRSRSNAYNDSVIVMSNAMENVVMPLIKSALFLLAALGMADIAYREPESGAASPYEGLQYVRPTALLRYVTGVTSTYECKATEEAPLFDVDPDHLLVRSLKADNPYLYLIADMATPISANIYKVDYTSFLKGSDRPSDVESKIAMFRQYVSSEVPPLWEEFFAEALRRCNPFFPLEDDYICRLVDVKHKELRHILRTAPDVRPYVILTESDLVLIKADCETRVANALRKHGYFL